MAIAGSILSWGSSTYNNFVHSSYSIAEAIGASAMDAVYYLGTGIIKYKAGVAVGGLAIKSGMFLGTSAVSTAGALGLGFAGTLSAGLIVGTITAIGVGIAGAYAIYYLGGLVDDGWEWLKQQIFE